VARHMTAHRLSTVNVGSYVEGLSACLVNSPLEAEQSIVISMSVSLSVCSHNSKTTHGRSIFTKFCSCCLCRGSVLSGGVATRYVLPVLWMT